MSNSGRWLHFVVALGAVLTAVSRAPFARADVPVAPIYTVRVLLLAVGPATPGGSAPSAAELKSVAEDEFTLPALVGGPEKFLADLRTQFPQYRYYLIAAAALACRAETPTAMECTMPGADKQATTFRVNCLV